MAATGQAAVGGTSHGGGMHVVHAHMVPLDPVHPPANHHTSAKTITNTTTKPATEANVVSSAENSEASEGIFASFKREREHTKGTLLKTDSVKKRENE